MAYFRIGILLGAIASCASLRGAIRCAHPLVFQVHSRLRTRIYPTKGDLGDAGT